MVRGAKIPAFTFANCLLRMGRDCGLLHTLTHIGGGGSNTKLGVPNQIGYLRLYITCLYEFNLTPGIQPPVFHAWHVQKSSFESTPMVSDGLGAPLCRFGATQLPTIHLSSGEEPRMTWLGDPQEWSTQQAATNQAQAQPTNSSG